MSVRSLLVPSVLALALVLAVAVFALSRRYVVQAGGDGQVYKLDRFTGQTWKLSGTAEVETKPAARIAQYFPVAVDLKPTDLARLDGKASLASDGKVTVGLYNGSSYILTELSIEVILKQPYGTVRYKRAFTSDSTGFMELGDPQKITNFVFPTDARLAANETWAWSIVGAKGYGPH